MGVPTHFLSPLLKKTDTGHVVRNRRTGSVIASRVETAFDSETRRKGLLGRTGLAPEAVLVIAPCNSVHTFFMKFPIDAVFVDREGAVLKQYSGLRPWRIAFAVRAFAVLELSAGTVGRTGLQVGDRLVVDRVDGAG